MISTIFRWYSLVNFYGLIRVIDWSIYYSFTKLIKWVVFVFSWNRVHSCCKKKQYAFIFFEFPFCCLTTTIFICIPMKDLSESSAFKQGISLNITILKLVRDLRLEYRFFFFCFYYRRNMLESFLYYPSQKYFRKNIQRLIADLSSTRSSNIKLIDVVFLLLFLF